MLPRLVEPYFSVVADVRGKKFLILRGLLIGAALFLVMFWIKSIFALFAVALAISASFSSIIPGLDGRLTDLMSKNKDLVGELTGISTAIWDCGAALGPIATGIMKPSPSGCLSTRLMQKRGD